MKVKCNQCGKPIEDEFLMIGDNFLQVNFFDEADGSDNVFCSQECICEYLSVNGCPYCLQRLNWNDENET